MAKKEKQPRILTCQKTGKQFEYVGYGRPPKYCPEIAAEVRKEQRKAAQKNKRAAASAARAAKTSEAFASA